MKAFFETGQLTSTPGGSIAEGIGQGRITGNMEGFEPDYCFEIIDEEMMPVRTRHTLRTSRTGILK